MFSKSKAADLKWLVQRGQVYRAFSFSKGCIWGISETTGASSDVYCQSINDNIIQTSCAFYVEINTGRI